METIDHTTENPVANVLSGYYKNAEVGAHSISAILPEVTDMKLRRELFEQRSYYESQKKHLKTQMSEIFLEPMESGKAAKYWSEMMIKCKAKMGMTTATAAKLMVEGTNMGMVQLHQVLNHNPNIPGDLKEQGDTILAHEKQYLDRLTPYL
jgi:hypothetical protein